MLNRFCTIQYFCRAIGYSQTLKLQAARFLRLNSVDISIRGIAEPVRCRPTTTDRRVLGQVFIDRDCDIDLPFTPKLIIDGGANVGYSSILLAAKYPEATILALEPDEDNFRIAKSNCSPYSNVQVLRAAIWPTDAQLKILNPDADVDAFRVGACEPNSADGLPGYSIPSLISRYGFERVDLLKLDIEGAEEDVFCSGNREWIADAQAMVIETHSERAERTVLSAVPSDRFSHHRQGEKLVFKQIDISN